MANKKHIMTIYERQNAQSLQKRGFKIIWINGEPLGDYYAIHDKLNKSYNLRMEHQEAIWDLLTVEKQL